jgi:hypothetical protein
VILGIFGRFVGVLLGSLFQFALPLGLATHRIGLLIMAGALLWGCLSLSRPSRRDA